MSAPTWVDLAGTWFQLQHIVTIAPMVVYDYDALVESIDPGKARIELTNGHICTVEMPVSVVMERILQAAELGRRNHLSALREDVKTMGLAPDTSYVIHINGGESTVVKTVPDSDSMSSCGPGHEPVQHRDGREPWCNACGLTEGGKKPASRFEKASPWPSPYEQTSHLKDD